MKVSFYDDQDVLQKEIEYRYDAFDRRIAKLLDSDGDQTIDAEDHFVYDGDDIVLQYDDSGSLTNRYLHGPAIDQVLAGEDALGDILWPLADNQGTVRDLVDSDGDVLNHIAYDAFGQITDETNSAVDHLYAYTGREWDPDAELYYYRARWYDPTVGRFLSEDPIGFSGGDANLSRYVGNSSPNFNDPSGLASGFVIQPVLIGGPGEGSYGEPPINPPIYKPVPIAPPAPPEPWTWGDYGSYLLPWNNPQGKQDAFDKCLVFGKWGASTTAAVCGTAAGGMAICGTSGPVIFGGGAAGVGGAAGLGIGSQAIVTGPAVAGAPLPAVMVNGTVYVARFHHIAWKAAGCGAVQKYGMVVLDKGGKVIEWAFE